MESIRVFPNFFPCVYIEKRVAASLKGRKNEAFHVKNLAFIFFIFIF